MLGIQVSFIAINALIVRWYPLRNFIWYLILFILTLLQQSFTLFSSTTNSSMTLLVCVYVFVVQHFANTCPAVRFRWPDGLCRSRLLWAAELWLWPPVSRLRRPAGPVAAEPAATYRTPLTRQHTHSQLLPPHTLPPWQSSHTHPPWRRALWYQVCAYLLFVRLTVWVHAETFSCLFCVPVSLSSPAVEYIERHG